MKARLRLIPALVLPLVAAFASAQQPSLLPPGAGVRPPASANRPAAPAIATVGTRSIAREEFQARADAGFEQYRQRSGSAVPDEMAPLVRRQVLESLIRRELLTLEAARRGILGSDAEAEAEIKKDRFFNPGGQFDASRFEMMRTSQPQNFALAMRQMREQLGARRLSQQIEKDFALTPGESRAAAERALATSEVRYLGLAAEDFPGEYAEPRESDVLEAYRRGRETYRRPERAVLTVVGIAAPELPDSLQSSPPARDAWNARMKVQADSVVRALRSGVALEVVAAPYGGARRNIAVVRDNFPGFWLGDARDAAAVFAARPGQVLDPVRSRRGWLVVVVDEVRPVTVAPLVEVVRDLRAELRGAANQNREERALRALYTEIGDSLRGPAVRVRWAWVDTTRLSVPAPAPADLERFLKSHLADYSYFDSRTNSVRTRPLAEVEDDVRQRWVRERREALSRATLDDVTRAWSRGARDAAAERRVTGLREAGPLPPGAPLDSTLVGRAVADSVRGRGGALGTGVGRYLEGRVVFQVYGAIASHVPTYEQAVPQLRERWIARRAVEDERGARAVFERDPGRFALGRVVHFSRLHIPSRELLDVPLSKAEVERYYRQHLERYSAPEEVTARHILFSVSGSGRDADEAARRRAEAALARLRGGESFAKLAQELSDDAATRTSGGDLGTFGRGVMLAAVEAVAFKTAAGEIAGPLRSEVGYHLLQVTDRLPAVAHPLPTLWTVVGSEAAREKSERLNAARADSIFTLARTPAQFRALAKRLDLRVARIEYEAGDSRGRAELRPVLDALATLKPGEVYSSPFRLPGVGYAIAWVESIAPPRPPSWESARDRATEAYRRTAGRRTLDAKRAELDSMLAQGWTLDSLATLWGGLGTAVHGKGGTGLPLLGGAALLDSLLAGRDGRPGLTPGQESDWVEFPGGIARVRFESRTAADPAAVAARAENERRARLERKLSEYYEALKQRWPVRILDSRLAQVPLPPPRDPS